MNGPGDGVSEAIQSMQLLNYNKQGQNCFDTCE